MTRDSRSSPDSSTNHITRFAPSPTGRLHLGHAYSAVLNHDVARASGGQLVLRIEDIDRDRCKPEFVDGIIEDLAWLGLSWDALEIQSDHAAAHAAALDRLRTMGLVYPCICTRAEIAASASAPHGDAGAVYPGTCRAHPPAPDDPRPVAWRLDVAKAMGITGPLVWHDRDVGDVRADPALSGDVVLGRKGLDVAYHLAVVVDDAAAGVTDVIRGLDLFSATHAQRLLQALLDLPTPRYRHHALIAGRDGKRLAKRTSGSTLADLCDAGVDPAVLLTDLRAERLPVGFRWTNA
ncbi:MAG: tRNA glutamyl-Q(34) synthetase GluQRS [Sphingomonadales bacterium]